MLFYETLFFVRIVRITEITVCGIKAVCKFQGKWCKQLSLRFPRNLHSCVSLHIKHSVSNVTECHSRVGSILDGPRFKSLSEDQLPSLPQGF